MMQYNTKVLRMSTIRSFRKSYVTNRVWFVWHLNDNSINGIIFIRLSVKMWRNDNRPSRCLPNKICYHNCGRSFRIQSSWNWPVHESRLWKHFGNPETKPLISTTTWPHETRKSEVRITLGWLHGLWEYTPLRPLWKRLIILVKTTGTSTLFKLL